MLLNLHSKYKFFEQDFLSSALWKRFAFKITKQFALKLQLHWWTVVSVAYIVYCNSLWKIWKSTWKLIVCFEVCTILRPLWQLLLKVLKVTKTETDSFFMPSLLRLCLHRSYMQNLPDISTSDILTLTPTYQINMVLHTYF